MSLNNVSNSPAKLSRSQSTPSTTSSGLESPQGPTKELQASVDLRSNSQRAGNAPNAQPAPRGQALKAMVKHGWGAIKHGGVAAGRAASNVVHQQIASHSRPASDLANSHGMSGAMTAPIIKSELKIAMTHLKATGNATVDLLRKTRHYDAGSVAERLGELKAKRNEARDSKAELLVQPPGTQGVPAKRPFERPQMGEQALMVATPHPHRQAARAATVAVRHAVQGLGHKIKQGLHAAGAKVWADQPSVAHAHKAAAVSHANKAIGHFEGASLHAQRAGHYGTIATRTDRAKASDYLARTFHRSSSTAPHANPSSSTAPTSPTAGDTAEQPKLKRSQSSPDRV